MYLYIKSSSIFFDTCKLDLLSEITVSFKKTLLIGELSPVL